MFIYRHLLLPPVKTLCNQSNYTSVTYLCSTNTSGLHQTLSLEFHKIWMNPWCIVKHDIHRLNFSSWVATFKKMPEQLNTSQVLSDKSKFKGRNCNCSTHNLPSPVGLPLDVLPFGALMQVSNWGLIRMSTLWFSFHLLWQMLWTKHVIWLDTKDWSHASVGCWCLGPCSCRQNMNTRNLRVIFGIKSPLMKNVLLDFF